MLNAFCLDKFPGIGWLGKIVNYLAAKPSANRLERGYFLLCVCASSMHYLLLETVFIYLKSNETKEEYETEGDLSSTALLPLGFVPTTANAGPG